MAVCTVPGMESSINRSAVILQQSGLPPPGMEQRAANPLSRTAQCPSAALNTPALPLCQLPLLALHESAVD